MNLLTENSQLMYASPVTKILWMMLLLAVRDRRKVITFSRKRGKRKMVVKLDNEHDMVPPPRHLYSRIVAILRRIGRDAGKNPHSAFNFLYTETGQEQKLEWFINHEAAHDLKEELNGLLQKVHDAEEADRKQKNDERARQVRRKRWIIGSVTLGVVAIIVTLTVLLFW